MTQTTVEQASAPGSAEPQGKLVKAVKQFWPAALVAVVLLIAWHLVATLFFDDRVYLLPDPLTVLVTGWENRETVLLSAGTTLYSAVLGYGIAIVAAMAFAVLMSQSKMLERSFYPWAVILQVTPVIAIAPIIILWFGFGQLSIIIISMLIAYFPILNNTHLGLVSTDRNQRELFALHRAGWLKEFWQLRLPGAIPHIIAGLRISAGLAVIGAILGEFIIGTAGTYGGIGVRIVMAQATLRTADLFAYVFVAAALGLFFFGFVSYLGHVLLRDWHESARTEIVD